MVRVNNKCNYTPGLLKIAPNSVRALLVQFCLQRNISCLPLPSHYFTALQCLPLQYIVLHYIAIPCLTIHCNEIHNTEQWTLHCLVCTADCWKGLVEMSRLVRLYAMYLYLKPLGIDGLYYPHSPVLASKIEKPNQPAFSWRSNNIEIPIL